VGAWLLVDEVYLDAVYEGTPRTSFHLAPQVIVTNSLTKIYGLSGLRCGWVLAQPDLARAMYQLNNLFAATSVHPAELMSVAAFQHLDVIRERARKIVQADRAALAEFLDMQPGVSAVATAWGTTAFLRLRHGGADEFLARLRTAYETSAAPGRFFEMPGHFRVGMGVNAEMFREGLQRVGQALGD
jgi:aspartate/methionine/tyrosine aminotransferase